MTKKKEIHEVTLFFCRKTGKILLLYDNNHLELKILKDQVFRCLNKDFGDSLRLQGHNNGEFWIFANSKGLYFGRRKCARCNIILYSENRKDFLLKKEMRYQLINT